jgi:DegV family protein with EDD domain
MARIKLITDSTTDLPEGKFQEYDIDVVPINIQFGLESYQEGLTIDPTTFYTKVETLGMIPQTSQPSVGQFLEVYHQAIQAGYDTILSIHLTSKLSGVFQSAVMAAQSVADRVRIHVYDSTCGSAALGFMLMEAVEMIRAGQSVEAILARWDELRQRVKIFITLKSTRYAAMSGRITHLASFIASVLNVKPIIGLKDGSLDPIERVRSRKASLERLLSLPAASIPRGAPIYFAVIHAQCAEEAQALLERGRQMFNVKDSFVHAMPLSLAVHFGPGGIGTVTVEI